MIELARSTALLTGASRGIGPFLAEAMARRGTNLILAARNRAKLEQVRDNLAGHGVTVHVVPADISTLQGVEALAREALERISSIDILINNAGMAAMLPFDRVRPDEIARELFVNLGAPLALSRLLLPGMLKRRRGHIVNMSSIAGDVPLHYEAVYGASKAGLTIASKALRMECRGTGVSVSVILPGVVRGVGMAEDFGELTGIRFPWFMGGCSPERVARGVIRAIEQDRAETIVNRPPMRGTLALFRLWPGLWEYLAYHLLLETSTRAAKANLAVGGDYTQVAVSPGLVHNGESRGPEMNV